MKRAYLVAALVLVLTSACDDDTEGPVAEVFSANLTGGAERPAVNTQATGTVTMTVNPNRTITYTLTATGMTPTVQHIHGPATADQSAGVITGLTIGANQTITPTSSFTGSFTYDSLLVLMRNNMTYVNVHSAAFPPGEIRGNLRRP